MKQKLIALVAASAAFFYACTASAQTPVCPDRPDADATSACANTKFVQRGISLIAPPTASGTGGLSKNWFKPPTPFISSVPSAIQGIGPLGLLGHGPGSVTATQSPSEVYALIVKSVGFNDNRAYIDPTNGTDAGTACAQSAPCKTINYCMINCTAQHIIGLVTGPFDVFNFNATTAARAYHRLTFDGPATITPQGATYVQPTTMTWTVTSNPNIYSSPITGLTGSQAPQRFMRWDSYAAGTGTPERAFQYGTLAALQTAANAGAIFGWFWDSTAKILYVDFYNLNVQTYRAKLRMFWATPTGDTTIILQGAVTLLVDAVFPLYMDGVSFEYYDISGATATLLVDGKGAQNNVKISGAIGNGVHGAGGFGYFSGVDCEYSQYDCFNFDPASNGTESIAIGHAIRGWYAGDIATYGTSLTQNRNGWSSHGGNNTLIMGASFGASWGPNVADTTAPGYPSAFSWLIGVESYKTASGDAGIGFYDSGGAVRAIWVDTCATLNEGVSLYGTGAGITIKQLNCDLNVPATSDTGATISSYTRNAP